MKPFENIVQAIKAIRERKPEATLAEDRELARKIMAIGVHLYKIEKNIKD